MSAPLRIATAATRSWVGAYTAGMPSERRAARRTEIESDLWEHAQAAREDGEGLLSTAREVLGRLARGMPSDLLWRFQKGGWEMQSTFVIERSTGVVMLLTVLLLLAATVGSPGISGEEPYFSYDFPSFVRNLDDHSRALIFRFALAGAMIPAADLLFLTFGPHVPRFAAAGSIALLAAGVLFLGAAVAGVRLLALAEVWRDGGLRGDAVWLSARGAAGYQESLGFAGALMIAVSFLTFGAAIARSTPLPRWLGLLAVGGAIVAIVGLGGLAVADAFWLVFMAGIIAVLASFIATGGWLLVRGTRPPAGPAASA